MALCSRYNAWGKLKQAAEHMTTKTPRTKPNIRMVAQRAQLSLATVSLALRGSESIAPETRERVLAAARELNYIPAPRAARAAAAEPHFLFVAKDLGDPTYTSNPFHGVILSAAEQACTDVGARLTFILLPEVDRSDEQLAAVFAGYTFDGVLLVGSYAPAFVRRVAGSIQAPLVLVDNVVPGVRCDSVMADDFGGGLLATRHLIELGHQRIAAIVGDLRVPSFAGRYRGYTAACLEAGLHPAPPTETPWGRAPLREALEAILAQQPSPTAMFCVNDNHAVFVIELLRDFGLRVPDDVSVVGFDNFAIARMAHPPLTTLHNHPDVLGRLGVQRLLARLTGDTGPALNTTVTTELIVRSSTRVV